MKLVMFGSHPSIGNYRFECPFEANDGGRSTSKRPKQRNDCAVRALALVTGASYDAAYDFCATETGRKSGSGTYTKKFLQLTFNGYRFAWTAFQAQKGEKRETPVTFAIKHPKGRYILKLSKHVLACVDGVIIDMDINFLSDRCVYGAYEAKRIET